MMTETRPSAPSPFRAPWLPATVAVILGALVMLGLGIWQLDRLQQRRVANAQIMARMSQPALELTGRALDPEASDLRRATVRGVFDYDQEVILRNRTYGEVPGVHQLVPLRITGSDAAVLVDRGWIPFEFSSVEQRAQFRNATGEVEIQGILRQSQMRRNSLSPADPPLGPERARLDAWFRVDLPRIQEQVPYRLLSLYLEEETPPGAEARWLPRPDPDIQLDEGSHFIYASQWFAFAAMLPLVYAFLYHTRTKPAPKFAD
jgi:surfeit locus 1 family protein